MELRAPGVAMKKRHSTEAAAPPTPKVLAALEGM
jgi:hypothetical protein